MVDKPEDDEDDGPDAAFKEAIRNAIKSAAPADAAADDAGGFDAPMTEAAQTPAITAEEGQDLAAKARFRDAEGKFAKTLDDGTGEGEKKPDAEEAKVETKAEGDKPAAEAKPAAKPAAEEPKADADPAKAQTPATDLSKASVADLLAGIDATRSAEIGKRIAASTEVMDLFAGKEEALKLHGLDRPHEAIKRLLYLNEFAQEKPDEYLAWVASQVKPNEAHTVLEAAAKRLGFKMVKDEPEDDEFADEETKRLRRENAELRAKSAGEWGPDAPQHQQNRSVQDTYNGFVAERGEDGSLKRPYFELLKPRITALATAHVQTTKKYVTTEDLQRFYDAAEQEARGLIGGNGNSAAQPAPPVQDQSQKDAAPAPAAKPAEKAASKMIDGDGPGASRRPALPDGADLMSTIRHYASEG